MKQLIRRYNEFHGNCLIRSNAHERVQTVWQAVRQSCKVGGACGGKMMMLWFNRSSRVLMICTTRRELPEGARYPSVASEAACEMMVGELVVVHS